MDVQIVEDRIHGHGQNSQEQPSLVRSIRTIERSQEWIDQDTGKETEIDRRASNADRELRSEEMEGPVIDLVTDPGEAEVEQIGQGAAR